MDGSFEIDLDALRASLRTVDHMLIRFTPLPDRLLLDFRTSVDEGPGVALLPQVTSFSERVATIERARPGFPKPERLYVVSWPLRIGALDRLGVLEIVRERLAEMDAFDVIPRLDEAYERLLSMEQTEILNAISGEGYHTLWPAQSAPPRRSS